MPLQPPPTERFEGPNVEIPQGYRDHAHELGRQKAILDTAQWSASLAVVQSNGLSIGAHRLGHGTHPRGGAKPTREGPEVHAGVWQDCAVATSRHQRLDGFP